MTREERELMARNIAENYVKSGVAKSVDELTKELLEDWDIWDEFIEEMNAKE